METALHDPADDPVQPSVTRRAALRLILSGASLAVLAACGPAVPATPTAPPAAPASAPKPTSAAAAPAVSATGAAKPTTAPAPTAAAAVQAAGQPKPGGRLRYGLSADLSRLDPHFRTPEAYNTIWSAYDRLTENDFELKQHPALAESWDVNSDATQIKFNLRRGVQFHTGREMTSDDVKWN